MGGDVGLHDPDAGKHPAQAGEEPPLALSQGGEHLRCGVRRHVREEAPDLHLTQSRMGVRSPIQEGLHPRCLQALEELDEGRLVGVITEDAIIQHVFGKPELMNAPVSGAMESAFIKLDRTTSVNNLVAMLHVQPYAAIMDGDEFLGLITRSDVLNYLRRQI